MLWHILPCPTENCQGQDRNQKGSVINNSNINEDNSVAMMNITGLGTQDSGLGTMEHKAVLVVVAA